MIEQAKGVIAERHAIEVEEAFDLMRRHARRNNLKLHDVAGYIVNGKMTLRAD